MQFLRRASIRNNRNVRWQELTYHDGFPTFAFSYGRKGSYRIQNIFAHPCEFLGLFGSYLEAVVSIFRGFSEDFRRFSKIVPWPEKRLRTFPEDFRAVYDDCRGRPKKIQRCLDHKSEKNFYITNMKLKLRPSIQKSSSKTCFLLQ